MGTGYLVDIIAFPVVMLISSFLASLMAYLLLGFADTLPLVLTFVVFFGTVAGGYFVTSSKISQLVARKRNSPTSNVFYSLMFVRGEFKRLRVTK